MSRSRWWQLVGILITVMLVPMGAGSQQQDLMLSDGVGGGQQVLSADGGCQGTKKTTGDCDGFPRNCTK